MKPYERTAIGIAASLERDLLAQDSETRSLPPVRQLAGSLRVSPATVAAAYKLLRSRGLVNGQGRQGTRVVARQTAPLWKASSGVPAGVRDLSTGDPDPALLPSLESTLRSVSFEPAQNGSGVDWADFVVLAASEFEADGIPASAVAVTNGGSDAIERILREHLRHGDVVAIEDPSFPGLVDLLTVAGYRTVPLALDDEGPLPDAADAALARGCQAVIVTPRAQNPTGAALSAQRAADLRGVLARHSQVLLIENDHAALVAGVPLHSIRNPSHERWAVVRSLSASLGPDLRLAVVAGDEVTIARVRRRQALGARWVSHILQQLAFALWSDPVSGRRIARVGEIYAERRARLMASLRDHGIAAQGRSGLNVWIPVRSEDTVARGLLESGWAVASGRRFRIQAGPGVRVTTSALLPEDAAVFAADLSRLGGPVRAVLA
ncbi:MAG: aminotransferase class I/II-fold pyridoxal phosphate-dependent enzyme [Acidobacteria bacterium]|nr:aminotransferase class I/II-fold pyridoxal phosphate-dependent enzyme [Acidobacteriota bacterium]